MRPKILGWLLMVGLILLGHPSLAQMVQQPKAEKAVAPSPDPLKISPATRALT